MSDHERADREGSGERGQAAREPVGIAFLLGSLEFGGAERHVTHLLEGLDRARFRPLLYLTRKRGPFLPRVQALGVPVRETGVRSVFTPSGARGIANLSAAMREEGVRIIHSYLYGANLIGAALSALDADRIHLVALRRQMLPHAWFFRALFRWTEGPNTRFISVSRAADAVLGSWGVSPRWRHCVPNGVRIPAAVTESERGATRAALDVPPEAPLVTMVANFHTIKGHMELLEAFSQLPAPDLNTAPRLCLVGDGVLLDACREMATSLGIAGRVRFPGRRADVTEILQASDLFVLNSKSEGMSNALLEALAAGLPCVATDVGGNPEVVEDGTNGILVPPLDPAPLARALERLLLDRELRVRMGNASVARARHEFSIEAMVQKTQAIYEEVLRRHRTPVNTSPAARSTNDPGSGTGDASPGTVRL